MPDPGREVESDPENVLLPKVPGSWSSMPMVARISHSRFGFTAILFLIVCVLFACTSGDKDFLIQPEGVPAQPTLAQARAVIDRNCVPCHHDADDDGDDEDDDEGDDDFEDMDLSTCAGLWEYRGDVLRVILDKTMPPGAWPRLDAREMFVVMNYFNTAAECPCGTECP